MAVMLDIPTEAQFEVPGSQPVVFSINDMTTEKAWRKLYSGNTKIDAKFFKDPVKFRKYWYLSLGLTEGTMVIHGPERSGKSLFVHYIGYHLRELFGKPSTFINTRPKKGYGDHAYLNDEMLIEELDLLKQATNMQNDLTEADDLTPEVKLKLQQSKLYGRFVVLDEAHQHLEKSRLTNRVRAYARLVRQYGHLHTLIAFATQDERDLPPRFIYDRKTHEVGCSYKGWKRPAECVYTINWRREGITKALTITPENWEHIWNTHNLVAGGDTLKVRM